VRRQEYFTIFDGKQFDDYNLALEYEQKLYKKIDKKEILKKFFRKEFALQNAIELLEYMAKNQEEFLCILNDIGEHTK